MSYFTIVQWLSVVIFRLVTVIVIDYKIWHWHIKAFYDGYHWYVKLMVFLFLLMFNIQ